MNKQKVMLDYLKFLHRNIDEIEQLVQFQVNGREWVKIQAGLRFETLSSLRQSINRAMIYYAMKE